MAFYSGPHPKSNPDTMSFIDAVKQNGGSLLHTEEIAVNRLVLDFKRHNVWNDYLAIYPMVGGTSNSCAINLKNPGTFDISWTSAVAGNFTSLGVAGDGTMYGRTGIVANVEMTNDTPFFDWYNNLLGTGVTTQFGAIHASDADIHLRIIIQNGAVGLLSYFEAYTTGNNERINYDFGSNDLAHFLAGRGSSTLSMWRNGTEDADTANNTGTIPSIEIGILTEYLNTGGTQRTETGRRCAGAGIGDAIMTQTNADNIYQSWTDFNTLLGRQN